MNFNTFLKKYGAYFLAVILFVAAASIYCSPVFKGQVIMASDNQNWMGAANEGLTYANQTGDSSWWSGSMFCGMPTYTVGAGGKYLSDKLLTPLNMLKNKGVHSTWWQLFLYFACFFVLFKSFGISTLLSIIGALATGLSSYFLIIIPSGHNTKVVTIAFSALTLAGLKFTFNKKYLLGAVLTMLSVSSCYSMHPQMFYYFYMMAGLMAVAELWIHIKDKRMKEFSVAAAIFVAATGIGVLSQSASLFATSEFTAESTRGKSSALSGNGEQTRGLDIDYATQWSYGVDETMTLLIPGFKGGSSSVNLGKKSNLAQAFDKLFEGQKTPELFTQAVPLYWGDQPFTSGGVYVGAIICFLFILGLFIVAGPYKWMLLAATIFSILLSWGHNFNWLTELFFKYFPLYSKFRAVSSILVVAEVAMPLLGILALKEIFCGDIDKKRICRSLYISAGITAGICLFFALFAKGLYTFAAPEEGELVESFPPLVYDALKADRASLLRGDALRSALFILGAAALIWAYVAKGLKQWIVIPLLAVLTVVDLWGVDRRYFNDNNFVKPAVKADKFKMTAWEEEILEDPDPYFRVYHLTSNAFNESRTSYRLKSLGGYSAVKLRLYQDLIDQHLTKGNTQVINMLNAKYIVTGEEGEEQVRKNTAAMGNAWWVDNIMLVNDAREESLALAVADLNTTAIVDKSFIAQIPDTHPGRAADARVTLKQYTPKSLDYVTSSSKPGLVVFSEIYYPHGWKATIDGEKAVIIKANYALRALSVPSGIHQIHFEFNPDSVKKGDSLAIAFIILMYLITLGAIAFGIIKLVKRKDA